jgi:hypothetical protein
VGSVDDASDVYTATIFREEVRVGVHEYMFWSNDPWFPIRANRKRGKLLPALFSTTEITKETSAPGDTKQSPISAHKQLCSPSRLDWTIASPPRMNQLDQDQCEHEHVRLISTQKMEAECTCETSVTLPTSTPCKEKAASPINYRTGWCRNNAEDLYSEGVRFESQSSYAKARIPLSLGYDCFLPDPYQSVILPLKAI